MKKIKVNQYTTDGALVASFDSAVEAARSIGRSRGVIDECCRSGRGTAGGYVWKYDNTFMRQDTNYVVNKKQVNQYSLNGTFIKTYESMTQACIATHTRVAAISMCCKGTVKSAGGYIWKPTSEAAGTTSVTPVSNRKGSGVAQYSLAGKPIATYSSVAEAAKNVKTEQSYSSVVRNITLCCKRKKERSYGFIWRYDNECKEKARKNACRGKMV